MKALLPQEFPADKSALFFRRLRLGSHFHPVYPEVFKRAAVLVDFFAKVVVVFS